VRAIRSLAFLVFLTIAVISPPALYAACTISPATLSFGGYMAYNPTPLDVTASLSVTCDKPVLVTISIGPSFNSGNTANRQMRSPSSSMPLNYNIYSNKKRTHVWGEGAEAVTANANKPITIYGRIPNGQDVPAGDYSDSMIMTITP